MQCEMGLMDDMIVIESEWNRTGNLFEGIADELNDHLSRVVPAFDHKKDLIRLYDLEHNSTGLRLTYEIVRNARRSKTEQNLSPYREKGIKMQVGRNS